MALQLTTTVLQSADGSYNPDYPAGDKPDGVLLGSEDWELPITTDRQVGGFAWDDSNHDRVTDPTDAGNTVLDFTYIGTPDGDGQQEERFNFDTEHQEIWVSYRLHIPANYQHRDSTGSDNNKGFINFWSPDYTLYDMFSQTTFWRGDDDNTSIMSCVSGVDGSSQSHLFTDSDGRNDVVAIGLADFDTWMDVVCKVKCSDKGQANGELEVWKNGSILASFRGLNNVSNQGGSASGYTDGYFFGYANSGFTEDTTFLFDDMKFGTTASSIGFTVP